MENGKVVPIRADVRRIYNEDENPGEVGKYEIGWDHSKRAIFVPGFGGGAVDIEDMGHYTGTVARISLGKAEAMKLAHAIIAEYKDA